jgi:arsenical pump membrane protein
MALPWLVAIAAEYAVFRRFFATGLAADAQAPSAAEPPALPVFALVTVVATLAGFVVTSAIGVDPA